MDGSKFGMGKRSQRYSMIVNDGVVEQLNVEAPGEYRASSAETYAGPAGDRLTALPLPRLPSPLTPKRASRPRVVEPVQQQGVDSMATNNRGREIVAETGIAAGTTTRKATTSTTAAGSTARASGPSPRPRRRSAARLPPGVFLWSRRNQISDQLGDLSDQISEWREGSGPRRVRQRTTRFERQLHGQLDAVAAAQDQSQIAEEAMTLKETGKKPATIARPSGQSSLLSTERIQGRPSPGAPFLMRRGSWRSLRRTPAW